MRRRTATLMTTALLGSALAAAPRAPADTGAAAAPAASAEALPAPGSQAYGWTAAWWHPGTGDWRKVMISPQGRIRIVGGDDGPGKIVHVSPDARHVLTAQWMGRYPGEWGDWLGVWDVAARSSRIDKHNGHDQETISATPEGYLLKPDPWDSVRLYAWDGSLRATYPPVPRYTGGPVATPDGRYILQALNGAVLVRSKATGQVVNRIPPPAGGYTCRPRGGWDATSGSMTCWNGQSRVYRFRYLPPAWSEPVGPPGWQAVWPTTPRLLRRDWPLPRVATWVPGQEPRPLGGPTDWVTGAVGDRAWIRRSGGRLDVVDLTTGRSTRLVPGRVSGAVTTDPVGAPRLPDRFGSAGD